MTSRKSFFNLIKICLRNNIWSVALNCIGLFFALPVYAALTITGIQDKVDREILRPDLAPALFRRSILGEGNFFVMFIVVVIAVVSAIGGFSYLFSKQKVDLYHSLPVKRSRLFAANCVSGVIGFAIPYAALLSVTLIIGEAFGMLDGLGIQSALITSILHLLGFAGVYAVVLLAVMLTGKTLVCILATGVFLFYGPITTALFELLKSRFFVTYMSYDDVLAYTYSSPVTYYIELFGGMDGLHGSFDLKILRILIFVILTAAVIMLDYYLYSIRPSEAADRSITFKKTMPFISVLLLVPAALFGGMGFEGIASNGGNVSFAWLIFGGLVVIIIGHFIIQAIFFSDFKSLFKNLINPAAAAVITTVIFAVFAADITGYDSFVPTDSELSSVAISTTGIHSGIEYHNFDAEADEYGYSNFWVGEAEYRFNHMKVTDTVLARDFAIAALEDSKVYTGYIRRDEDLPEGNAYTYFEVCYTLKSGRKVYRCYTMDILRNFDIVSKIYENEDYKTGVFDILTDPIENMQNINIVCPSGTFTNKLSAAQTEELIKTYRNELITQKADELKNSVPVCYMYNAHSVDENGYKNEYRTDMGYIYPSFTKTLALLKDNGIDVNGYINADNIESIIVRNYHYDEMDNASDSVETDEHEYTSAEDIEKIFDVAIPNEMSDINSALMHNETLELEVKFKKVPGAFNYSVYYSIPKGKIPDFVRKDVNFSK